MKRTRNPVGRGETAADRHLAEPESHPGGRTGGRGGRPERRMHRTVASRDAGRQSALLQIERQWKSDDPDGRCDVRRRHYPISRYVSGRQRIDLGSHVSRGREEDVRGVGARQGYVVVKTEGRGEVKYELVSTDNQFFFERKTIEFLELLPL